MPAGDDVEQERHRAVRERRVARRAGDRAAHLVHVDLGLRTGRRQVPLDEPVDQSVVEPERFVPLKYDWMPLTQSGSSSVWMTW